jgi:hypothetical protein
MSTFGAGGFACVCFVVCRHDFADCFSVFVSLLPTGCERKYSFLRHLGHLWRSQDASVQPVVPQQGQSHGMYAV